MYNLFIFEININTIRFDIKSFSAKKFKTDKIIKIKNQT